MESGIYKAKSGNNHSYYTVVDEDKIALHPVTKTEEGWMADTSTTAFIYLNRLKPEEKNQSVTFVNRSFDLDVLTILFKYRPGISNFPNQLNTKFNGAGYLGYRSDLYLLTYL
jgi:hypothetical protein